MDAEMALWHSGAGRAQAPSSVRKEGFSVLMGTKGQPARRAIPRSLSLREHTSDVKKPSIRREALRGVDVPVCLA